jgi:hypothetical protein
VREGGRRRETHVERLPEPATRIVVEKRTASGPRVDEVKASDRGGIWHGLLEHEWFQRGLEAQKRRKRDINHLKQETGTRAGEIKGRG